jgi:hypothetical protein
MKEMKKLVSIIVFSVFALAVSAQINVATNGNVGVKTTTPATDFTVNGATTINALSTPNWGSAIRTTVSNIDACAYHLYNNYYSSDVFYVVGEGRVMCRLGLYQGSDINLKEDIKEIESPLSLINSLHGVKYKYKDPSGKTSDKDERIGLIAQDVEKVVPQAVSTMNDGTMAISYSDLIGVIIEAMKEQQKQIETLQKQVADLTQKSDK